MSQTGQGTWEREEDLEGLEDNEMPRGRGWELVEAPEEEHKGSPWEELKDAAAGGAAPAPALAWPA